MSEIKQVSPSSLREALACAQGEFAVPKKTKPVTVRTKTGGTYNFSYAPLEEVLAAVVPALAKYRIARYSDIVMHEGRECVKTTIAYGAEELSSHYPIIVVEEGAQKHTSGVSYARRNGLNLLLGISAEDDDDGNIADGNEVSDRRPHTTAPAANGKPAASGKVKPLPTPPGKPVFDPETGEVHGTRPQAIVYDQANPIAWGGRLVAEVTGAKTRAEAEAWIATNLENLQRCEREAPKVYDRVDANIEATRAKFAADEIPADFMPAK